MFRMVVIKLTEPRILLTPATWREKIPKSTAAPGCPTTDKGGYTVQPVPAPLSAKPEVNISKRAGGNNQNLILFKRGNAISGALSMIGTNQLPKPPIIVGITKKKIITKACEVTITLYNWSSPSSVDGIPSSIRINALSLVPINADQIPNRRYIVPISLWLVEYDQRNIFILFKDTFWELRVCKDLQSLS